ncbi:TPA: hypothetical protein RU530_002729 [Staphylococcus aureus]|nr:hypothetical protein [Staphylococcus aureus]
MTVQDKVQTLIEEGLDTNTKIISLDANNHVVFVKYFKGEHIEYAVLSYNDRGIYNGRYFPTFAQSEKEAFQQAYDVYRTLAFQ